MPPPQHVKDFVKNLRKVLVVRLRRFKNTGPGQRSSTTTDHAGDGHSRGISLAREASDMAQLALPLVQAIASAIPFVGAPMQAAIGGLLIGLQAIDRRSQNQADLNNLILRLNRLGRELCNAPPALDPVEQSRRDSFVRMLQDTSAQVSKLRERCLASTSVTQAIAACFVEIDHYLAEYLWSSQMQSQRDIREMLVILQREQEGRQNFLMTIESLVTSRPSSVGGCVTLIDATGHQHPISVNFCTSFEQFNEMLKVLLKCNSVEARVQRRYMESGQYDLCIDEGTQVTQLTSNEWPRLEPGTKVVMNVIIEQQSSFFDISYKCLCGAVNTLSVDSITRSLERQAGSSNDCRKCARRFQISREKRSTNIRSPDIDFDHTTDAETDLIRNFHIKQSERMWNDCSSVVNRENIPRHVCEVHFPCVRYTCGACDKEFRRPNLLQNHVCRK